jgi:hypothetical protein
MEWSLGFAPDQFTLSLAKRVIGRLLLGAQRHAQPKEVQLVKVLPHQDKDGFAFGVEIRAARGLVLAQEASLLGMSNARLGC